MIKGNIPKGRILVKENKVESFLIKSERVSGEVIIEGKETSKGDTVTYDNPPSQNSKLKPPIRVKLEDEDYWLMSEANILYIE